MQQVCFIADVAVLPRWLKVGEAVDFVGGVHPRFSREKCEAFLARTKIKPTQYVRELSKGMVVQLHLALVMAIDAKLLVLDEPTLGLDILYRKEFYQSLLNDYFDENKTIIVTTHQVEEIEHILTDLMFIKDGRLVLNATMDEVGERYHRSDGRARQGRCRARPQAAQRTADLRQVDLPVRWRRPYAPRPARRAAQAEYRRSVRRDDERNLRMNTSGMNTSSIDMSSMSTNRSALTTNPTLRTFGWLVKREFWEHRGGFMRAPFIIAIVMAGIVIAAMIAADVTAHRNGVNISGLNLSSITDKMTPESTEQLATGLDVAMFGMCAPIMIGMTFVVFFYLLGALYDDRRDRSVLFFKSLPISDTTTVLSKIAAAAFVAPVFAVAACIAFHIVFLVLVSIYALLHNAGALALIWRPTHLLALWIKLIVLIPINALWALPTIGWLLLCSSFVRSKPFLFAVLLPTLVGVVVGWINLMQQFALPSTWYWRNVFFRIVCSIWPGSWLFSNYGNNALTVSTSGNDINIGMAKFDFVNAVLSFDRMVGVLMAPELWVGVVAGAALIVAAIHFRQKRTEAYS